MAIKVKPTKIKKEKPVKMPKTPKAPKAPKIKTSVKVSGSGKIGGAKPTIAPKITKPAKPSSVKISGAKSRTGTAKIRTFGKDDSSKNSKLTKILVLVGVALIATAIVIAIVLSGVKSGDEVVGIYISKAPTNIEYYVGDSKLSTDGIILQVLTKNGKSYAIEDSSQMTFSGFDTKKATQSQEITVSYEGFTATFSIIVKDVPKPVKTPTGLNVETLPKTEYKVGERLNTDGGILAFEYEDGSLYRVNLELHNVNGFKALCDDDGRLLPESVGEHTLIVRAIKDNVMLETTYQITVTDPNAAPEGE